MQNKKKLSLASINIKSFVTTIDKNTSKEIVGGDLSGNITQNAVYCQHSVPGYCLKPLTNNDCTNVGCGDSTDPSNTGGGGGKTNAECIEDSSICSGLPVGCN